MSSKSVSDSTGVIKLEIPASSEWVRVARLTVAAVASRMQFGFDDIEDIKLAVAEAINNSIQHSPRRQDALEEPLVTIEIQVVPDGLKISVSDEGQVTESLPVHDSAPRRGDDNLPESGLGLLLIRSLMDEVSHVSGPDSNTTLSMFKQLPPRFSGGPALGGTLPRA